VTSRRLIDDPRSAAIAWGFCLAKLALHMLLIERYGYHRDELYFIACGEHLAFGYVDHAPLVPWIAAMAGTLFDHSLFGLRILPAVAGAATILLTARLTRELGGGRFAVLLACLAAFIPPAYLRMGKILCIPVFEPLFWTAGSLLVLRLIRGGDRRLWLAVGAVVGVGLLNKHSMLLWVAGLGAGLLLTPLRRELRRPMPWLGLAAALLIASPNLVWQIQHDWATFHFLRQMSAGVLAEVPRSLFLLGQILYMHPFTLPLWLAGLWFCITAENGRYRVFAWSFVTIVAALLVTHAKPYYLAPAYPVLFAAGAVWTAPRLGARWMRVASVAALLLGGAALAAISVPVLSVDRIDRLLAGGLGWVVEPEMLTQELHDEHGWPEQVAVVARVHATLPPEEKPHALVLTANYGQAGAVDHFGPALGLPHAASGHMSYHDWGIPPGRGEVVIAYGFPQATLERLFADVRAVERIDHPLAMPHERNVVVFLCREPRVPLADAWPTLRRDWHGPRAAHPRD
jgi:hypothetical protein